MVIDELNTAFGITNQLSFIEGDGGLPFIEIDTGDARAVISVYGGQVLSFQPKLATDDVLFLSERAHYQVGKAIKGGIPICWPWFGDDPEGQGRSAHGFARNSFWSVIETSTTEDGFVQVTLGLDDSEESLEIWPHTFNLRLNIWVGKTLRLELQTVNTGDQAIQITQALHTYFSVGDIAQASVQGLADRSYIDKTTAGNVEVQQGDVTFNQEVDRIYTEVTAEASIIDAALKRKINIVSSGSHSTVVWNPWKDIAASMSDLNDEDYQQFLCVETANAAPDVVDVLPGAECCITAEYSISGFG